MFVFAQVSTERFTISRFVIEGSTLLAASDIDLLVEPYVGPQRDYADIQRALEAVERAYRQRGYSAVQVYVPEQELHNGTVRLQVTETRIDHIRISNAPKYFNETNIRRGLPALIEGSTPNAREISRQVALNNENPAKQVEVVLSVGEVENAADATVVVTENDPFKLFAILDNSGSRQTGNYRLTLGLQHANLGNSDHVGTFAWITAPDNPQKVAIGSISYRIPMYDRASAIDLIAAHSNVDVGTTPTTAGPLSFAGKGDTFGFRYTYALPRQGEYRAKVVVGWDYKAFKNDCSLGDFGAAGCGSAAASVNLRPVGITYSGLKLGPGQATDYSATFVQNIPGGHLGNDLAFEAARPSPLGEGGAKANYRLLKAALTHLRMFGGDWQLRGSLSGQWTDKVLLPQEQLGLSGANGVRGFLEREVARDQGYLASMEVYSPELGKFFGEDAGNLRMLAFYDYGSGRNNLLPGESQPRSSLSSIGVGLRYAYSRTLMSKLDVARVLVPNGAQDRGDVRAHFNLAVSF